MSMKEFADRLNGRQYGEELTQADIEKAKEKGFVIIYGQSDDLMEIRGAIDDEFDCYNGGTFFFTGRFCENEYDIKASWCAEGTDATWSYKTDIPHEEFKIYDGDELYCIGIVFDIKDLCKDRNDLEIENKSYGIEETIENFKELKSILERNVMKKSNKKCFDIDFDRVIKALERTRWIPVSERMPEEHDSVFAKFKSTDKWDDFMWEKVSDFVLVSVEFDDGETLTDVMCTHDGKWYHSESTMKRNIIAWMELPEPYKGEKPDGQVD